jgi:hypothetical protein
MYKVRLESFNGNVATVTLPNVESVNKFLEEYPSKIGSGVSLRVSCDALGITGTLIGKNKI